MSQWTEVRRGAVAKASAAGRRAWEWLADEWARCWSCRECGHPVHMLDRVCNQCGSGDPFQVSRPLLIVAACVGVPLILAALYLAS